MKLRIIADKPVFNGRSVETIELSGKRKPINHSELIWEREDHFEAGFWALLRKDYLGRTIELRFRSDGRYRPIEELRGVKYKDGWYYEDFMFSVIQL